MFYLFFQYFNEGFDGTSNFIVRINRLTVGGMRK